MSIQKYIFLFFNIMLRKEKDRKIALSVIPRELSHIACLKIRFAVAAEVLDQRMQEKLEPYAAQLVLLDEIPGVDWSLAAVIIAELGVDMSVFQSVSQLAFLGGSLSGQQRISWQAQEQPHSQRQRVLEGRFVEAAHAAATVKGTYLRDKFYRLKARRGYKRAAVQ